MKDLVYTLQADNKAESQQEVILQDEDEEEDEEPDSTLDPIIGVSHVTAQSRFATAAT